jgi:O-antigen/teichoic acid export membrane protein
MHVRTLALEGFSLVRFKRLAKEILWVGAGQATAALGGLAGLSLLTRALDPGRYGELALGMTVASLTQQAILGPVSGALLRFFAPAAEARQLEAYLKGARNLTIRATAVLWSVGALLALALWALGQVKWIALLITALLFSLLAGYNSALDGVQNAARQRAVVAWHQGVGQWLRFLLAVALIGALGAFSSVAMLGYAVASALVLASQTIFFRRRILASVPASSCDQGGQIENWTRQMRQYAWPFTFWGVFTWAQMASDRWALQVCGSASTVGLYAALYQLGYYPMLLLSGFMLQLVTPVLFGRAGDGTDPARMVQSLRLNGLIFRGSILLTALSTVVALLFHQQIFSLLVAPEYRRVSSFLPWMILGGGLFAAAQIAGLSLLCDVNSRVLLAPKIITAVLGVVLNFAGAHWFGLAGVVYGGLLFSLTYLAWVFALAKRHRVGAGQSNC